MLRASRDLLLGHLGTIKAWVEDADGYAFRPKLFGHEGGGNVACCPRHVVACLIASNDSHQHQYIERMSVYVLERLKMTLVQCFGSIHQCLRAHSRRW